MKTQACTPSDLTRQTDISFFMCGTLRFGSFKSTQAGLLLSLAGRWATPLRAAASGPSQSFCGGNGHMVRSPKKSARPWRWKSALLQRALAPYPGPPSLIPEQLPKAEEASGRVFTQRSKPVVLHSPGHMFAAGVFPPFAARRCLSHYAPSHSFRDSLLGIFQDWIKGKFVCAREYQ